MKGMSANENEGKEGKVLSENERFYGQIAAVCLGAIAVMIRELKDEIG